MKITLGLWKLAKSAAAMAATAATVPTPLKCLLKLASFSESIWYLASPSYDSKVSIYTLTYWCTWFTMLAMFS